MTPEGRKRGQSLSGIRGRAIAAGLLAIVGSGNTLLNDFTYDDFPIIVQNPSMTSADGAAEIWTHDYWWHTRRFDPDRDLLYRPFTLQTYRWQYQLHGLHPAPFHVVNVLLHGAV